jgi:hypothetical protein
MLTMVWVQDRNVAGSVCATWMLLVREQRAWAWERERTGRRSE